MGARRARLAPCASPLARTRVSLADPVQKWHGRSPCHFCHGLCARETRALASPDAARRFRRHATGGGGPWARAHGNSAMARFHGRIAQGPPRDSPPPVACAKVASMNALLLSVTLAQTLSGSVFLDRNG